MSRCFCCFCVYEYVFEDDRENNLANSGAIGFDSGILLWIDPFIEFICRSANFHVWSSCHLEPHRIQSRHHNSSSSSSRHQYHPPNSSFEFQTNPPRIQSNSSEPRIGLYTRGAPVFCVPPFQLATPPRFEVKHIPKGNLVLYFVCTCTKCIFFAHRQRFISRPRVFPRALGCGARRGPARTLGASLGPGRAPWRVVWALKVARANK